MNICIMTFHKTHKWTSRSGCIKAMHQVETGINNCASCFNTEIFGRPVLNGPKSVMCECWGYLASFPDLFFFSLVCVDNSTGEWRSSKNWEGLGALITWVTSGGCEMDVEGAGPHSRFCWSSISLSSSWLGLSALLLVETLVAVDNSAQPCLKLWLALSSLCPLNVAHMMNAPRLSPFSPLFHFCVLLSMQTKEQEQGRPGNEARGTAPTNYFLSGVVLWTHLFWYHIPPLEVYGQWLARWAWSGCFSVGSCVNSSHYCTDDDRSIQ